LAENYHLSNSNNSSNIKNNANSHNIGNKLGDDADIEDIRNIENCGKFKFNFAEICQSKLAEISDNNLQRNPYHIENCTSSRIIIDKQEYINFASNDYFGIASNQALQAQAYKRASQFGLGNVSSRFICGNSVLYQEAEALLCDIYQTEAACIFGSGYLTNIGVIPQIIGHQDLVIFDKLCHSCIIEGILLSKAKYIPFKHNDISHLQKILMRHRQKYKNCLIITEGIFSMDGDKAKMAEIASLAREFRSITMVDNAHSIGLNTIDSSDDYGGYDGYGCCDGLGNSDNHIQMGTLSKAVGAYGGYICAKTEIVEYVKQKAKSLMFSTALPYPVLTAIIEGLKFIKENRAECQKSVDNAKKMLEICQKISRNNRITEQFQSLVGVASPIVPIILGSEEKAIIAQKTLMQNGKIFTSAIRPPTVKKGQSRLRLSFSSSHTGEDITKLCQNLLRADII